jgi:lysophospholipase L1-like esterase
VSKSETHKAASPTRRACACALVLSVTALLLPSPLVVAQLQVCDPHELTANEAFWQSDLMSNETVMMLAPMRGGIAEAQLLWPATEILSVRDSTLGVELRNGIDYTYEAGTLRLASGMTQYALPMADLSVEGQPRWEENHWYHTHQLVVTYLHEPGLWTGPLPAFKLERLRAKLGVPGAAIRVSILGDSIARGYSASGFSTDMFQAAAPYLMPWPQVVACRLQERYGVNVLLNNPSVAGSTSEWGREVVRSAVSVTGPDLVVIAFGMNDASQGIAAVSFESNIQAIIDDVRALHPSADFVIVAFMLAHSGWALAGDQAQYQPVLTALAERNGAALVDMTTTHSQLLTVKRYADTTGNGVNHPNDFLSRWYGYLVSAAISP